MKFTRLSIHNLFSHEDTVIDLADRGLVLIDGPVGAGKSSIFNSLCWVLYGQAPNETRADTVIREGQTHAWGSVEFLDEFGRKITVTRYRRHPTKKNQLVLEIDGENASANADKETQRSVEVLTKLDYKAFVQAVYFPQRYMGLASLTDSEQKEILSQILDLGRFEKAKEKAKALLSSMNSDKDAIEREIALLQERATAKTETLQRLRLQYNAWNEAHDLNLFQLRDRLARLPQPQEAPSLAPEVAAIEAEIRELEDGYKKTQDEMLAKERFIGEERGRLSAKRMELTLALQKASYAYGETDFADSCPTCEQPLQGWKLDELNQARKDAKIKYEKAQEELSKFNDYADSVEKNLGMLRDELNAIDPPKQLIPLRTRLELLQEEQRKHSLAKRDYEREKRGLEIALERAEKEDNPYAVTLANEQEELDLSTRTALSKRRDLVPLLDEIKRLEFWVEGFSAKGVESLYLSTVVPYLNERINFYLHEMSEGRAVCSLTTQTQLQSGEYRDKLSIEARFGNGPSSFHTKSGGEKQQLSVALALALGDLTLRRCAIGLRVFDEPFDGLSGLEGESVVRLLRDYVTPAVGTVFVVSHSAELKPHFTNVLRVTNESGVSRVEE